jgi:hypothetical protein
VEEEVVVAEEEVVVAGRFEQRLNHHPGIMFVPGAVRLR